MRLEEIEKSFKNRLTTYSLDGVTKNQVYFRLDYIDWLISEVRRLQEIGENYEKVINERCPTDKNHHYGTQGHCSCVPSLTLEVRRLREGIQELIAIFNKELPFVVSAFPFIIEGLQKLFDEKEWFRWKNPERRVNNSPSFR